MGLFAIRQYLLGKRISFSIFIFPISMKAEAYLGHFQRAATVFFCYHNQRLLAVNQFQQKAQSRYLIKT